MLLSFQISWGPVIPWHKHMRLVKDDEKQAWSNEQLPRGVGKYDDKSYYINVYQSLLKQVPPCQEEPRLSRSTAIRSNRDNDLMNARGGTGKTDERCSITSILSKVRVDVDELKYCRLTYPLCCRILPPRSRRSSPSYFNIERLSMYPSALS